MARSATVGSAIAALLPAERAGQCLEVEPAGDRDDGDHQVAVEVGQQGLEDLVGVEPERGSAASRP